MPDLHKKIKTGHLFTIKLLIMNNLNQNQHARTVPDPRHFTGKYLI